MESTSLKLSSNGKEIAEQALSEHNLSKSQLAINTNVARSTVTNFFSGKAVSTPIFLVLCGKLNLNWENITCRSEETQNYWKIAFNITTLNIIGVLAKLTEILAKYEADIVELSPPHRDSNNERINFSFLISISDEKIPLKITEEITIIDRSGSIEKTSTLSSTFSNTDNFNYQENCNKSVNNRNELDSIQTLPKSWALAETISWGYLINIRAHNKAGVTASILTKILISGYDIFSSNSDFRSEIVSMQVGIQTSLKDHNLEKLFIKIRIADDRVIDVERMNMHSLKNFSSNQ
ncbi:MAG: hypothetical protein F6K31_12250 [Symploca sp. SIO2G7]|nr:hypothetical protein [Symploca sp. SIO2G7]